MENQASPATRELGRFIAALRKQWLEELGRPEARATEAVIRQAERLLAAAKAGTAIPAAAGLEASLDPGWLAMNPWARPHLQRLASLLTGLPGAGAHGT